MCTIVHFLNLHQNCCAISFQITYKVIVVKFQQQCIDNYRCKTVLNWVKRGTLKIFQYEYQEIACIFNNVLLKCSSTLEVHSYTTKKARDALFLLKCSSSAVCRRIKD